MKVLLVALLHLRSHIKFTSVIDSKHSKAHTTLLLEVLSTIKPRINYRIKYSQVNLLKISAIALAGHVIESQKYYLHMQK